MKINLLKKLNTGILLLLLIITASCAEEKFEPDPEDERIPAYTEKGNNISGALVNGFAWKTEAHATIYNVDYGIDINKLPGDTLSVNLNGEMNEGIYKGENLAFEFVLPGVRISEEADVLQLQGRQFLLDSASNQVFIRGGFPYFQKECGYGKGEFVISHIEARKHNNGSITGFVMSGTFSFSVASSCANTRVTEGRFDYFVRKSEFYN